MQVDKDIVEVTQEYYNSRDADNFYHTIWGGEDIHVGIYSSRNEDIFTASNRTVRQMLGLIPDLNAQTKVLDVGSGYGGAARYLASKYQCSIDCLNLSEVENERNRRKNQRQGLDDFIEVHHGNFESLPFDSQEFDLVWSEDAILHSRRKKRVFEEVARVMKKGGHFVFTDPMQSDICPEGVLQPILDRIHLKELGSVATYKKYAADVGLQEVEILEMPEQLTNHYSRVHAELSAQKDKLRKVCSLDYIEKMEKGLLHWIEGGKKDYLNWGILHFRKS